MILSDAGIEAAIAAGDIEIEPPPAEYSTSAVDLLLADEFQSWDADRLLVPGVSTVVDLAEQRFPLTARAYLKDVPRERDGAVIFPPFRIQSHMLAITRERVHLKIGSQVAARVARPKFAGAPRAHGAYHGSHRTCRVERAHYT